MDVRIQARPQDAEELHLHVGCPPEFLTVLPEQTLPPWDEPVVDLEAPASIDDILSNISADNHSATVWPHLGPETPKLTSIDMGRTRDLSS